MFSFLYTFCMISFPASHQNLLPLQSWYIKAKQPSSYADRLLSPESTPFVRQWMSTTTVFISQLIEERPLKIEYPGAQNGFSISKLTYEDRQTTAAPSSPLPTPESVFHHRWAQKEKKAGTIHTCLCSKDSEHCVIKQTENTTKTGEKVPHVSSALVLKEEKLLDFLSPFPKQIHFHFLRFVSQH